MATKPHQRPGGPVPGDRAIGLVKRSFSLAGHRTSVALEPEFWAALEGLARTDGRPLSALVAAVDAVRAPGRPLASALRVHALERASTVSDG